MATISKANRPRRVAGMTRNGRVRLRSQSVAQLEVMLEKSSDTKSKGKIRQELIRQQSK